MELHYVLMTTLPEISEGFPSASIFQLRSRVDDSNPSFVCVLDGGFSWEPVVVDTISDLYDLILRYLPLFQREEGLRDMRFHRRESKELSVLYQKNLGINGGDGGAEG
jgi:hypothetical protein